MSYKEKVGLFSSRIIGSGKAMALRKLSEIAAEIILTYGMDRD